MKTIQKLKQTEIGEIPEDWEVKNIIESSTLKARIGWQGLTTAEYLDKGNYFLVGGTNFDNGKVNWDSCFYVSHHRYSQDVLCPGYIHHRESFQDFPESS